MSTSTTANESGTSGRTGVSARLLREGYGPGAWHGADMKAALADVDNALAYWRPAVGRHNIAEIATHHAYVVRSVRAQLSGQPSEPFVLSGEDWFDIPGEKTLSWQTIQHALQSEHARLDELVETLDGGKTTSPLSEAERLDLVLGITCHAVYHAGQIQLLKRLREGTKE
jgi:DinB superfamily